MNYKRLSSLLVASLIFLLLVSFGLICTWFYFYFHAGESDAARMGRLHAADSSALVRKTRDSLQQAYRNTISRSPDSAWRRHDTSGLTADNKLEDYYRLRNEIGGLLKENANLRDLDSARRKIGELQQRVEELRNRTAAVESENRRLQGMVEQLNDRLHAGVPARVKTAAPKPSGGSLTTSSSSAALPGLFAARELRLRAFTQNDEETALASEAVRLSGTFTVHNPSAQPGTAEVMVVILQPNGKVLQGSAWESGVFETRQGRQVYSVKIPFDYPRPEDRKLSFSLSVEDLPKGEYQVLIYHNGSVIGRGATRLE